MTSSVLFIFIGLFAIILTILKPSFYWNSRKARGLRRVVGDLGATIIYLAIGLVSLYMGIKQYL